VTHDLELEDSWPEEVETLSSWQEACVNERPQWTKECV